MTPPPEHRSEIMRRSDDPAVLAVEIMRTDVGGRFDRLDRRLDTMVTRDTHDATVQRLDAADAQLRRDLADHEAEAQRRFDLVEKSVAAGDKAILTKIAEEHAEQVKTRRWVIGSFIAFGGFAVSATALLLNLLT
ncbi:hypothetical protein UQW22_09840 [Isoptericola halotolerans]|uniref:hypothetical protein n=1 Tax=Isoptericola halotolerans TaxID=300560 RepID=UPI00388E486B